MEQQVKPVFDEQTLARVLEAAYVLQEHNRARELKLEPQDEQLRKRDQEGARPEVPPQIISDAEVSSKDDYTRILAKIVETQNQIQVRQLELESAMALVAERLTQITGAGGAAVVIVEGKIACYRASSGSSALPRGTKLPMEKALCFTCLRTGHVMRCSDVNPEFLLDAEECHRRGIQSVVAVPVYHDGGLIGALELYFEKVNGFKNQDIHTCELMAGLVTEALTRDTQLTWKKSVAAERATMREAIERLQPNLAAFTAAPVAKEGESNEVDSAAVPEPTFTCRKCGHSLVGEEQFCGQCGAPRLVDHEPASMQSKVASLWQMQQTKDAPSQPSNGTGTLPAIEPPEDRNPDTAISGDADSQAPMLSTNDLLDMELARLLGGGAPDFSVSHDAVEVEREAVSPHTDQTPDESFIRGDDFGDTERPREILIPEETRTETEESEEKIAGTALEKTHQDITWTSAAAARDFLEQIARSHRTHKLQSFWNARRGEIYLALALLLMALVIRWGMSSHASASGVASAASHRKAEVRLSLFEKFLVNVGIAEPPDKPEPKGNPGTQVWVDLHTALYYCPGADLYGKTPTGKFTSQKDAQLDQFEPAYRKACD